ncbi:GAP family protein [Shouchella clausii]|uniref:GAP family protein n=1 Tax=Shouchella clausii TaxID=79880 RepID=UPI00079A4A28|nr:hypothetical protein WZ76_11040 [Shouchella clausii]
MNDLSYLIILALIDSLSFGTLLIPLWLLISSKEIKIKRFSIYIVTVVLFYFITGLVLVISAEALLNLGEPFFQSTTFQYFQLILGVSLIIISYRMDSKTIDRRTEKQEKTNPSVWRDQLLSDSNTAKQSSIMLISLAFTACLLEVATMLPYLLAIGIISSNDYSLQQSGFILFGYCIIMILPALILLMGRVFAHNLLKKPLIHLEIWLSKNARNTTAWIIGIVGFILAANAIYELELYHLMACILNVSFVT